MPPETIYTKLKLPIQNLWVFGYGSLMWDPGFKFNTRQRARIYGFHRSLCIRSVRYRGTDDLPGLVFGLDHGGSCTGIGYQIKHTDQREVSDYLQDREMLNNIYDPSIRLITLENGQRVKAIVFIVKRHHPSYVRNLTLDQAARMVATAAGQRGPNIDYLLSTLKSLDNLGIHDKSLHAVGKLAQERFSSSSANTNE